jgi:hypothetical protein
VQLTDIEIDFHPDNVISLPAELDPPLKPQRFAFRARACAGIGCPTGAIRPFIDSFFEYTRFSSFQQKRIRGRKRREEIATAAAFEPRIAFGALGAASLAGGRGALAVLDPGVRGQPPVHVFPARRLTCFCLELQATGEADFTGPTGHQQVRVKRALDGALREAGRCGVGRGLRDTPGAARDAAGGAPCSWCAHGPEGAPKSSAATGAYGGADGTRTRGARR